MMMENHPSPFPRENMTVPLILLFSRKVIKEYVQLGTVKVDKSNNIAEN